jgi:hypothetical protein
LDLCELPDKLGWNQRSRLAQKACIFIFRVNRGGNVPLVFFRLPEVRPIASSLAFFVLSKVPFLLKNRWF